MGLFSGLVKDFDSWANGKTKTTQPKPTGNVINITANGTFDNGTKVSSNTTTLKNIDVNRTTGVITSTVPTTAKWSSVPHAAPTTTTKTTSAPATAVTVKAVVKTDDTLILLI